MIFQDPMMTLNPVLRVDTQMIEAVQAHRSVVAARRARSPATRWPRSASQPRAAARRPIRTSFPAACASAWPSPSPSCNKPDLVIADEPTTALDVTIQAQILHEAQELCRKTGTAHDLDHATTSPWSAALADRMAVMYAGRIVEEGRAGDVIARPAASLYEGPVGLGAHRPTPAATRLDADPRHDAVAAQLAAGLRFPPALPSRGSGVLR